jgi:hypothetical protein
VTCDLDRTKPVPVTSQLPGWMDGWMDGLLVAKHVSFDSKQNTFRIRISMDWDDLLDGRIDFVLRARRSSMHDIHVLVTLVPRCDMIHRRNVTASL